jgi:hypothetical protein
MASKTMINLNVIAFVFFVTIFWLIELPSSPNSRSGHTDTTCERRLLSIYRIDSTKNFFLIYGKDSTGICKIFSRKFESHCPNLIASGKHIGLCVHSYRDHLSQSFLLLDRMATARISCYLLGPEDEICVEGDSIRDLFFSEDFVGLCQPGSRP